MCNDLFREAAKRGIALGDVEVEAEADFVAEGAAARSIRYHVRISGDAAANVLRSLVQDTDAVTEIQNTVRGAVPIVLDEIVVR